MFIPPKTVRVIYNVFIHGLIVRSLVCITGPYPLNIPPPRVKLRIAELLISCLDWPLWSQCLQEI